MKTNIFMLACICLMLSCRDEVKPMMVIKNCSGSYLSYDGSNYKVCNSDILNGCAHGTTVNAVFVRINKCEVVNDKVRCLMEYPPYKHKVRVIKVIK